MGRCLGGCCLPASLPLLLPLATSLLPRAGTIDERRAAPFAAGPDVRVGCGARGSARGWCRLGQPYGLYGGGRARKRKDIVLPEPGGGG